MSRVLKSLAIFTLFSGCLFNGRHVQAAHTSPVSVVEQYVQAIDNHDWQTFENLYCSEEQDNLNSYFSNAINRQERNGVINISSADFVEAVEISESDVDDLLNKSYEDANCIVYALGMDLDVYEDTKYFSDGVNYNFIVLVEEDGEWKVSEFTPIAEPSRLVDAGYCFSDDYAGLITVMEARNRGIFVNYNGEFFGLLSPDPQSLRNVLNPYVVPTNYTPVRYKASNGVITTYSFHNYCLGVVAGEARQSNMDGVVRRAQVIATKTFTWHFVIVPKNPIEGYDVNYLQQSYRPDKISENPVVSTDYNAVMGIWMESYGGAIFEAHYYKGSYSNQSSNYHGGSFYQDGARWLKDNNVATTYKALLKYYYDSSSASTGGAIRFFDDYKNEI